MGVRLWFAGNVELAWQREAMEMRVEFMAVSHKGEGVCGEKKVAVSGGDVKEWS